MKQTPEELAAMADEANRLKNEPAFQRAVLSMHRENVAQLIACDPTSTEEIRRLQANIRAVEGLTASLAAEILRTPRMTQTVV